MKTLFLDIDGVLNYQQWFIRNSKQLLLFQALADNKIRRSLDIDTVCVANLNKIVEKTNCDIVISSSWRQLFSFEEIADTLKLAGFKYPKKIVGSTPGSCGNRESEILSYIFKHNLLFDDVVVLDDWRLENPITPFLVRTDWFGPNGGLTEKIADMVIQRFNKN